MSIRLRLTLLYSAVLALTLLVFGLFLYFRTGQNQRSEIDRSLISAVDRVQNGSGAPGAAPNSAQNGAEPSRRGIGDVVRLALAARLGDPALLVQLDDPAGRPVLDPSGQPVLQSPGLTETALPTPKAGSRHFENVTVNRVPLRMLVAPVDLSQRLRPGAGGGQTLSGPLLVLVARSLADTNTAESQLRFILIAGSVFCLVVAAGAGWLLARNGLQPIARLTAEARDIGRQQDFKRRVGHDGPDDEVGRLAATFNTMLDSLDAAHERVRRALDAQRRFVADASHELRTPLTTIRGNVELLCLEGGANADQQEALGDIASESERMSRLVNNLLALARADAGFQIPRAPLPLEPVVAEAVQKARRLADGAALRLGESAAVTVQAEHDYLLQLLLILLDNALKYTPPDGTVTVSSRFNDGAVRLAVQDTGAGIAPEDQVRIFDRFFRADPSRHGSGTGLGLAIAAWIAQELGGKIELESVLGRGSTFTVVVPAVELPAASPAETAALRYAIHIIREPT